MRTGLKHIVKNISPDDCIQDYVFHNREVNRIGQTFGNLKVIGVYGKGDHGRLYFVVQ